MRVRRFRPTIVFLAVLSTTLAGHGQIVGGPTPIPGWQEPYEVDAQTHELVRAQGLWARKSWVDCAGLTCSLELDPLLFLNDDDTDTDGNPPKPFCPDLEIVGKPHLEPPGHWGGVLVGEDLFLTVHSLTQEDCPNHRVVFDYAAEDAASALLADLAPGETLIHEFPASKVRSCERVLAGDSTAGWTLVRLDEPVTDRRPVKLRRSGQLPLGSTTRTAGYPNRLPLKIEESPLIAVGDGSGASSAHVLGSSSGSAVLGPSNRLEGVVCCGNTGWMNQTGGCYQPIEGASSSASFDRPKGADLALVPALGLDVATAEPAPANPLRVEHFGPPGGPFSFGSLKQTLSAGQAGEALDWAIALPLGPVHYFAPVAGTPLAGHLEPGESINLTVAATVDAEQTPTGIFGSWIAYIDSAYDTIDVHEHLLNVGVDSFDRVCVDGTLPCRADGALIGTGPSGLLAGDAQTYRLTSRWDTAQRIRVLGPSWIAVTADGAFFETAPGTAVFDLAAGATADVTVTVTPDGTIGSIEDLLVFQSEHAGAIMHKEQTLVRGDLGRITADAEPMATFFPGDSVVLPTTVRLIDPTPALDVDVCLTLWPNMALPAPATAPSLRMRAPSGLEIALGALWGTLCFSHDVFDSVPGVVVGIDSMALLEGEDASGPWTLLIDAPANPPWPSATVSSTSWRLRIDPP